MVISGDFDSRSDLFANDWEQTSPYHMSGTVKCIGATIGDGNKKMIIFFVSSTCVLFKEYPSRELASQKLKDFTEQMKKEANGVGTGFLAVN